MSDLALCYTRSLHDNFQPLYANWEPSRPVQLGDYGLLRGRSFIYLGNVRDVGISFDERNENRKDHKVFSSKGSTELRFNARGTGPAGEVHARANLEVNFSSEEAVFFNAAACTYLMIRDKVALGRAVKKKLQDGKWDRKWAVLTDLVQAGATTLAVSGGHSASIVFEAAGDVPNIDLADAAIGLGVRTSTNVGFQLVAARGLVPLFGLCKMQRAFPWTSGGFEPLATAPPDPDLLDDLESARQVPVEEEAWFFGQLP